jgi:hypothetical protein
VAPDKKVPVLNGDDDDPSEIFVDRGPSILSLSSSLLALWKGLNPRRESFELKSRHGNSVHQCSCCAVAFFNGNTKMVSFVY